MNFCGIICEFNPFHNGHEYIISEAKRQTSENIICLMSGDFVQRGTPAIENKYERANKASIAGADMVVELPAIYATSNAENFAYGAIKILNKIGCKHIAFGIEKTNLTLLQKIAKLKYENSEQFQNCFRNEIENGINYNTALKRSIAQNINEKNIEKILEKPNNILAIEYLTAILKLKSKITPIAIERCDDGYYSKSSNGKFASATKIRELIQKNAKIDKYVPIYAKNIKNLSKTDIDKYETLIKNKIVFSTEKQLSSFYDYNEGIEYRIKKECLNNYDLKTIINNISTPRYRVPRINKLLLYPLIGLTKEVMKISQKAKPVAKVLQVKNKSILKEINRKKINLIICNKDYNSITKNQQKIMQVDLNASYIYNLISNEKIYDDKIKGTVFNIK